MFLDNTIKLYMRSRQETNKTTSIDTFVEHMSAYHVTPELIQEYTESVNNAYKTAVTTNNPQVVMGEGDLFFLILPNSIIVVCETIESYNLMTEKEFDQDKMRQKHIDGELSWREYREYLDQQKQQYQEEKKC